jgi:hypothetical protein
VQQSGGTPPFGHAGFVVVGRVVGLVVGLVVVRTVVVGNEQVGLLAPFVQQYFPFPLLAQPLKIF